MLWFMDECNADKQQTKEYHSKAIHCGLKAFTNGEELIFGQSVNYNLCSYPFRRKQPFNNLPIALQYFEKQYHGKSAIKQYDMHLHAINKY